MKKDGTLAKMYEKWYGSRPDRTSTDQRRFVGYGAPGFKGYDVHAARAVSVVKSRRRSGPADGPRWPTISSS